jgi:hypothetical protein
MKALLEDNAPYQARVTFEGNGGATGWNAPSTAPWFEQALNAASRRTLDRAWATSARAAPSRS